MLAVPATAIAREPVISYVDESDFRLYDEESESEVNPPPPVPVFDAAQFRYGMSMNGRYITFRDAAKKIHLLDRATNTEVPLPGVDVYTDPQNLTVSNNGLIGFDKSGQDSAVVYDGPGGTFVETGFPDPNGHRQPRMSGDGRFLGTTCISNCVATPTMTGGADAFVQDLAAKADKAFPADDTRDEEHPCLDGDGSLLGIDKAAVLLVDPKQDIFMFDRTAGTPWAPVSPGTDVNDSMEEEVYCVLDSSGRYLGFMNAFATFMVYDRTEDRYVSLPTDKEFDRFSVLSDPYSPSQQPGNGGNPGPTGDAKPVISRLRMTHRRFRVRRRATSFKFNLSEPGNMRIVIRRLGRRVGEMRRRGLGAGANAIVFSGKLGRTRLRPGEYTAVLIVTDRAGNRSLPVLIEFRVLRPKQRHR